MAYPRRARRNPADLRPLPYGAGALAPFLDAETVEMHHGTHQRGYVDGWNKGEERQAKLSGREVPGRPNMLRGLYEGMAYNGAGVILHEMYWENLCPAGEGGVPSDAFVACARSCFSSPREMIDQMVDVGSAIRGSGWVILAWIPRFGRMVILPVQEHEMRWIPGAVPLIVIDVWEHAYYKQYGAKRREYLQGIWPHINWDVVNQRHSGTARSNPKGYPWMKLKDTEAFVPLARKTKTSEVARSPRGFYTAFKRAGGQPSKMGNTHPDTPNREPYPWTKRREEFIKRHMGQVRSKGEKLWKPNGDPTKRHLGLIMWAYTPDPAGVRRWLKKEEGLL